MCGRFTQYYTWPQIHAALSVVAPPRNLQPRYNISPTDTVDVMKPGDDGLALVPMRWGLIPSWWKKSSREMRPSWNARADTIEQKPSFREAFRQRRCLIPASGLYEFTGPKTYKQGHYFTAADGSPLLLIAGLWDRWHDPEQDGIRVESCTMIVSDAREWMQAFHDRLVVTLSPEEARAWLDGSLGQADIEHAPGVPLLQWPVSRRVNNGGKGKVDDEGLILPL